MYSADEQHTSTTTHHHDANEERVELPTEPGTDAEGVVWRRAPEPYDDYLVGTDGRVVSLKHNAPHQLAGVDVDHGHLRVRLCGGTSDRRWPVFIHRLVWTVHVAEIPDGWYVHHKDCDPSNNRVGNLEAMPAGAHSRLHAATLTEDEVAAIKGLCDLEETTYRTVATAFDLDHKHVWSIHKDVIWPHVEPTRPDAATINRVRDAA